MGNDLTGLLFGRSELLYTRKVVRDGNEAIGQGARNVGSDIGNHSFVLVESWKEQSLRLQGSLMGVKSLIQRPSASLCFQQQTTPPLCLGLAFLAIETL